jgi:hypothetical protein
MTFRNLVRNSTLIVALGVFIVTAIGCSNKDPALSTPSAAPAPSQYASQIIKDNGLSKELTSEGEIIAGQVYMQESDKMVIGTLVTKKGTDKKTAESLAQKYAHKMRLKYKNKKVSVYAVSVDGKMLASIVN